MIESDASATPAHGPREPSVALVSGFWGQNIGNAFFNVGGKWILDQVFGASHVAFIQDQPGYRTFNDQSKGNPKRDVGLLKYLDVEYLVLQGPLLTRTITPLWADTLEVLTQRGVRIILLGTALFRYSPEEIQAARAFLQRFPPHLVVTRDHRTYEAIRDVVGPIHSGIDSAFFVPRAYTPLPFRIPPYVAMNFDRRPEPNVTLDGADGGASDVAFDALGHRWSLAFPRVPAWFARQGKALAYVGALADRRRLPATFGDLLAIRPEHRFNPHMTWKIYRQPNAVASDEPFTYFNVYAHADLTITDRVHAAVMTLAYGNPAVMLSPSRRSAIFDRLDLSDIRQGPATLDPGRLAEEQESELAFLREHVG